MMNVSNRLSFALFLLFILCSDALRVGKGSREKALTKQLTKLSDRAGRIMISFETTPESCLVREPGFKVQNVQITPCSKISLTNLVSAAWVWLEDGRLCGINGFCLRYQPDSSSNSGSTTSLIATECNRQGNDTTEIWSIRNDKLWSGAFEVHNDNISPEKDPIWRKEAIRVEKYNETRLISLQELSLESAISMTKERFRQMVKDVPDVTKSIAELTASLDMAQSESANVETVLTNVTELIGEIKADLMGHPTHIGQGVVVEVLETTASTPSASFLSPKFEVSSNQLRAAGINPTGPVTVRLAGYLIPPKAGSYRFVVKDLTSQFRLTANGVTVIDQWSAPAMGTITSNPPISIDKGEEIQLIATASGVLGIPYFKVWWKSSDVDPENQIPTEALYPSIVEPLCSSDGSLIKADCATTFNKIKTESEPIKVSCPSGCLAQTPIPRIFGTPTCYHLGSSICVSAIHSGVSGERGGSFMVQINLDIEKPKYPGVEGFHLSSLDAPMDKGCASIASTVPGMSRGGFHGIEVSDKADLIASDGSGPLSGVYSIITSNKALIARRKWGSGFLKQIVLSCGSAGYGFDTSEFDDELQLTDGSTLLIKNSETLNDLNIDDFYITVDQAKALTLFPTRDGWSRLSCQTNKNKLSLYFKHSALTAEYQYPSLTVTCEDTFKSLKSPLQSFVVRCPRFCFKSFASVIGLFSYSSESSICRSAIHAGVIADGGGSVHITRLPLLGPVKWSSLRNGITSITDELVEPIFTVDVPSGRKCIYPEHPGGLSHVSAASPKFEGAASFLQMTNKDNTANSHSDEDNEGTISKFKKLSESLMNFNLSGFEKGKERGLADLKSAFESSGQHQSGKAKDIENRRLAISMVETLIQEKLKQEEERIRSLEAELVQLEVESIEPYTHYDRISNIFEDWIVIDGEDAALGPSSWSMMTSGEGTSHATITQKSSIASKNALGTALILKGKSFDKGFMAGRVKISEGGYGTFGFIVKYLNDEDYIVFEISNPSTRGSGYIGFRRVHKRAWSPPEGQLSFEVPNDWITVGIDFGRQNARAFVNGGQLKTGIDFDDSPITGGTAGLITNALGTDVTVLFDSIVLGPLESQEQLAKGYFGSDEERKNVIRVELLKAKETEQVIPIEGTSGEASSLPSLPQTNLTAMVSESVNMTLGPDKVCLRSYADPMDTSLNGWLLPKDTGSWTLSTGGTERFILGTPKDESGSVLYLSRKSCQEGSGLRMSVSIRPQKGVRAGIIFRAASPTKYFAALLDLTERGPQVLLSDVHNGSSREFTTGTGDKVLADIWHTLEVQDYNNLVRVNLDGITVLQTKSPIMAATGSVGLMVEHGVLQLWLRNYESKDKMPTRTP